MRTGYRLKLVLRDPAGITADLANKLLRLKREDLAAVLAGRTRPPAVGTLMFVDLERGLCLHGEPAFEALQVGSFLPVPLAGMFAAGALVWCLVGGWISRGIGCCGAVSLHLEPGRLIV